MKKDLIKAIKTLFLPNYDKDWTSWEYSEDVNNDVLDGTWLDNGTSFIYKVAVCIAIDANKSDWVYVAIGTKRYNENCKTEIKGTLSFPKGENEDIGRVLKRALKLMRYSCSLFDA